MLLIAIEYATALRNSQTPLFVLLWNRNLSSMGLKGTLPPQIGTFQALTLLDLTTYNLSLGAPNAVTGPLPDELGNLSQLELL